MQRLLSLPPNAVKDYYLLHNRNREDWFCTSDPRDQRLGSGSGTTWLLEECYREEQPGMEFMEWLSAEKRILIHAGGQTMQFYDLYSDFGLALGNRPAKNDDDVNKLTVKILPLNGGEFYHYGTSREMISSTLALQNKVFDQRLIMHRKIKPNPAIFTQNALINLPFTEDHRNIWIENAQIGNGWRLSTDHVITGVPENDWQVDLPEGICIDMVPVDEMGYAVRPYGIDDVFKGETGSLKTIWMGKPVRQWLDERGLTLAELGGEAIDLQQASLFPCLESKDDMEKVLRWMIGSESLSAEGKNIWLKATRFSADELMDRASLSRLYAQRTEFRQMNYPT